MLERDAAHGVGIRQDDRVGAVIGKDDEPLAAGGSVGFRLDVDTEPLEDLDPGRMKPFARQPVGGLRVGFDQKRPLSESTVEVPYEPAKS